jgi:hypothetical protein
MFKHWLKELIMVDAPSISFLRLAAMNSSADAQKSFPVRAPASISKITKSFWTFEFCLVCLLGEKKSRRNHAWMPMEWTKKLLLFGFVGF